MTVLAWWQSDPDDAPTKHEPPTPPLPRVLRDTRRFVDPWAAWLTRDLTCEGCGGRNGHGSACPNYLKELRP